MSDTIPNRDIPNEAKNSKAPKQQPVSGSVSGVATLLLGFGVGIGLAILFAPQSGEETREWLNATAEDQMRQFRRKGRRLVFEAQDLLDRGDQQLSRAMRTGKSVLNSVASKLD